MRAAIRKRIYSTLPALSIAYQTLTALWYHLRAILITIHKTHGHPQINRGTAIKRLQPPAAYLWLLGFVYIFRFTILVVFVTAKRNQHKAG